MEHSDTIQVDTIVIGAGQAGLATGHHLKRRDIPFVILESHHRVGDGWRRHWESLRLFTPGRFSALPGVPSPVGKNGLATRDEFAAYLEAYAVGLPVRTGVTVTAVTRVNDRFEVTTTAGPMSARQIVVASGPNRVPRVPSFARDLDPGIRQLHSSEYQSPSDLPVGDVLVVGAGTSGAQIALELAATRRVFLSGRPTVHIPDAVFRFAGAAYWFLVTRVLTIDTPPGRKVAAQFGKRGSPLISISMEQVEAAGVTRLPRIAATAGGRPIASETDGTVGCAIDVASVIWATGYSPDLGWLPRLALTDDGLPATRRGVVEDIPGLYFVGMPFQYGLTSGLIGGVGRDAAFIADRIAERAKSGGSGTIRPRPRLRSV
jgi:putative flavoprotein involved in K+ transport